MKYILILLISFAFAQVVYVPINQDECIEPDCIKVGYTEYPELHRLFNGKGIATIELICGMIQVPTTLSYEIYAEECYNDSTWITISAYNTLESSLIHYKVIRREGQYIIMSRKPTFEGFIEWLNKKEKNQ